VAGGDFRRSRRRERGAKDLVRRHFFFFFFFFFACARTRPPRRVQEETTTCTLSKEKFMWRPTFSAQSESQKHLCEEEDLARIIGGGGERPRAREEVCPGFSYVIASGGLGALCLFLLFFQKKIKNCAFAPSKTHFASSVLVLSNVAYIHSNSHYGKFKISSRFRAEEVIRDAMRAMAGSVRVRARYRARGGVRDLGAKFFFRFSSPF